MRYASHCTKADATDKAQLLTVPPNAFAFFAIIGNSWHSDRTHERPKVSFPNPTPPWAGPPQFPAGSGTPRPASPATEPH